jgi:hypothetical protein
MFNFTAHPVSNLTKKSIERIKVELYKKYSPLALILNQYLGHKPFAFLNH